MMAQRTAAQKFRPAQHSGSTTTVPTGRTGVYGKQCLTEYGYSVRAAPTRRDVPANARAADPLQCAGLSLFRPLATSTHNPDGLLGGNQPASSARARSAWRMARSCFAVAAISDGVGGQQVFVQFREALDDDQPEAEVAAAARYPINLTEHPLEITHGCCCECAPRTSRERSLGFSLHTDA